jgi:hypothetical protein
MKVKTLLDFINEQSGSDYDKIFWDPSGPYGVGKADKPIYKKLRERIIPGYDGPIEEEDEDPFMSGLNQKRNYNKIENDAEVLYHSVEPENLEDVMEEGLHGQIYLTKTPQEARKHHPIVLKINVKGRKLTVKDEGFVVKDVPVDQITEL